MTIRKTFSIFTLSLAALLMTVSATAQADGARYTPKDKIEVGLHGGVAGISGDFDFEPGFGVGLHLRKALDYVFSLRASVDYHSMGGSVETPRNGITDHQTNIMSGSLQGVATLTNLRWDKATADRKFGIYAFGGVSAASTSVSGTRNGVADVDLFELNRVNAVGFYFDGGVGAAIKISPKFNIGVEGYSLIPFGKQSDLLDGYNNVGTNQTTFRDIIGGGRISLNFNIGGDDKTEPLYWSNPLENVITDISELQARPVFDLTDTDGDGVIDMIDAEKDSPEGAPVNTRGEALDSDGDGVADYQDEEPYSPPGYSVDGKGVAQQPDYLTEDKIQGMIDKSLEGYNSNKNAIADWFLPMIHFNLDSYSIRYSDYGSLSSVATVMKNNPSVRIVVKGFTDKTASDNYNSVLSYNRAKSAIDHLVQNYGISRDRLILNYGGENNTLVPQSGISLMNRRVEFQVATSETEMARPDGPNAGKGTFGGNRAGY